MLSKCLVLFLVLVRLTLVADTTTIAAITLTADSVTAMPEDPRSKT